MSILKLNLQSILNLQTILIKAFNFNFKAWKALQNISTLICFIYATLSEHTTLTDRSVVELFKQFETLNTLNRNEHR